MYITREDLHVFYYQVHHNVAKKLGISDFEWKSTNELDDEIGKVNSQVSDKMKTFIKAYEAWFKVHEEIESTGNAGNLTTEQNNNLMKAIDDRDSARKDLVDELAKL
jgi:prephenate dehydratase